MCNCSTRVVASRVIMTGAQHEPVVIPLDSNRRREGKMTGAMGFHDTVTVVWVCDRSCESTMPLFDAC
jgi:hypothetical protein